MGECLYLWGYHFPRMTLYSGSPPHTRGKATNSLPTCLLLRITPAHAGKSVVRITNRVDGRDHPRTRGEKLPKIGCIVDVPGSPPHTRGKVCTNFCCCCVGGITPAHAGKSNRYSPPTPERWDHPRTRGEKLEACEILLVLLGSPPHTRGKAKPANPKIERHRITPAHAGKSHRSAQIRRYVWDHPRTRGEKSAWA